MNRPYYTRHKDDEIIDEITLKTVPRYKTSGLSGDEWRISAVVELKRKGEVMYSRAYTSMDVAVSHLPWLMKTWIGDLDIDGNRIWHAKIRKDEETCHQPSCAEPSTVIVKLKRQYSREGYWQDLSNHYCEVRRGFCDLHSTRGDGGLEDADRNYEVIK